MAQGAAPRPPVFPLARKRRWKLSQSSFELPRFSWGLRRWPRTGRGLGSAADWVRSGRSTGTLSHFREAPETLLSGAWSSRSPGCAAWQRPPTVAKGTVGSGRAASSATTRAPQTPAVQPGRHLRGCAVESGPHLGCEGRLQSPSVPLEGFAEQPRTPFYCSSGMSGVRSFPKLPGLPEPKALR